MEIDFLIERIKNDAKKEASEILKEARAIAKQNIEYAGKHRDELIKSAKEHAKKEKTREKEVSQSENEIRAKLVLLNAKTKIVDDVFKSAIEKVKYNFRIEKHKNYELRLTKEELGNALRDTIEKEVVELLFGGIGG